MFPVPAAMFEDRVFMPPRARLLRRKRCDIVSHLARFVTKKISRSIDGLSDIGLYPSPFQVTISQHQLSAEHE